MCPSLWVQDILWGCIVFWKDIEIVHLHQVFFLILRKAAPSLSFWTKIGLSFCPKGKFWVFLALEFSQKCWKKKPVLKALALYLIHNSNYFFPSNHLQYRSKVKNKFLVNYMLPITLVPIIHKYLYFNKLNLLIFSFREVSIS